MSVGSGLMRAIARVERVLPFKAPLPGADDTQRHRRRAGAVMAVVSLSVLVPLLVRNREVFGDLLRANAGAFADMALVAAICIALAGAAFGVRTWRDAGGAH